MTCSPNESLVDAHPPTLTSAGHLPSMIMSYFELDEVVPGAEHFIWKLIRRARISISAPDGYAQQLYGSHLPTDLAQRGESHIFLALTYDCPKN